MSRSLKKGPFADASLLKKIDAMNAEGQKQIVKTLLSEQFLQYGQRRQDDESRNGTDSHEYSLVPVNCNTYAHSQSDRETGLNYNLADIGANHTG